MSVRSEELKPHSGVLLFDSEGLSNYTCYLARGISKFRQVILYSFAENSYIVTGAALEKNVKFKYIKKWLPKDYSTFKGIIRVIILFFILLNTLNRNQYDIVHIQEHLPMFFFFIPLLKLRGKKIFWTLHDTEIFIPSSNIHGKLQVLFSQIVSQPKIMMRWSDVIIVHAVSLKKQLIEKKVDQNKIHVIPHFDYNYLLENNSINTTNSNNSRNYSSNQNNLSKDYALFFGAIAPWKGIEVLIEATKIVIDNLGEKFNLVIAGTPYDGYRSYFNDLISEESKCIKLIKRWIESYEIPPIIKGSKFLILPYTERFNHSASGIIPLAYTFSKPVVVSSIEPLKEYVEHDRTGLIFKCGDSRQLANCIIELVQNHSKCSEMGRNAHEKMLREMSIERCCEVLNKLYNMKE
jgi:glycosyltransferase involved in cell wall biosynthesis